VARGSFLLIGLITRSDALILLTLFFWALESFPVPAYTRLMQAIFPAATRGRVMAVTRAGMSLTGLLVTPLFGWLLDTAGHQVLYPLTAVSALISIGLFTRLRFAEADLPPGRSNKAGDAWGIVRQDRRFALYLVGLTCFGFGLLSGIPLFPLVQVDQLGLSYSEIGALGLVQSAFFLLGYMILGRQIDRRGGLAVLRWVFVVGAIIPITYLLAASGWMLAPAFAALGLVNAGMDLGALNTVMQIAEPGRLGEYSAVQTTVLGMRGLLAPFLGVGLIGLGVSYPLVFGLGAGLILIGAFILWRVTADRPASI
jgi:hypothetical protein